MAVGELLISIFPDEVMFELFTKKNKVRTLVSKHFEKYSVSLGDFNKIDAMDIEKFSQEFLKNTTVNRGQFSVIFYGNAQETPFTEIELDTVNQKEIKQILPLEVESLGDAYEGLLFKHVIVGSKAKLYFSKKNIVDNLITLNIGRNWEMAGILPSTIAYQGLVPGDGILVEVGKDSYTIFTFRGGYLSNRETFSIYTEFSIERPLNPTVNEVFDVIQTELYEYVRNHNFSEGTDLDVVHMNFLGNVESAFISQEVDDILFETVRDLRNWLSISTNNEEFRSNKYSKETCNLLQYSVGSIGYFYIGKHIHNYNFSPERLSIVCKNLLITTLSFSVLLAAVLPTFGFYTADKIESAKAEVQSYESNIASYKTVIEGLGTQIATKDSVIADYNSYVSSLSSLTDKNRNFISGVLGYLPENTPATVIVQEVKLDKDKKTLKVKGVSKTYKDIGSFAIELEEFGNVKIPKIENNNLVNDQGYPFELHLTSK